MHLPSKAAGGMRAEAEPPRCTAQHEGRHLEQRQKESPDHSVCPKTFWDDVFGDILSSPQLKINSCKHVTPQT